MEERRARIILLDSHNLDLIIQVRPLQVHLYEILSCMITGCTQTQPVAATCCVCLCDFACVGLTGELWKNG